MMIAIGIGIPISQFIPGDGTSGGSVDVWEWEAGIALQWEAGINIPTE